MPNKILVKNPYLNEFLYDLLYNITDYQRKGLTKPHLSLLKSAIKAKNFCEFSTIDEKIRLLGELGVDCSLVFFQDKVNSVNGLKKILEKYDTGKQAGAVNEIAKLKVFVSSDKQVKWLLGLMADGIHHKSYFINQDYNKLNFHIKNWSKRIDSKNQLEVLESLESMDAIVKTFLNGLMALSYLEGVIGMKELELKILLYLYMYKHTYIEKVRIWDYFINTASKKTVTCSLKRLFLTDHIKKHSDYSKPRFSISAIGVDAVNKYVQHILKQNQF